LLPIRNHSACVCFQVTGLVVLDTTSLSEEHKICFALEVGAKHLKYYTPGCFAPSGDFLLIFCDTSYTLLSNKHGLKKKKH